jgi:class 3 adenylate cyclase
MRIGRPTPPVILTVDERETLEQWARRPKTAQALAQRARIVLACATEHTNGDIARAAGVTRQTVGRWRTRFAQQRLPGLLDEPRPVDVGWRKRGHDLGMGIGIAQGYATIGAIGFEGRLDYGAIGTVTNLAARLCGEASATEILVSQRVAGGVENLVSMETLGPLTLKGFARPVPAFRVLGLRTP